MGIFVHPRSVIFLIISELRVPCLVTYGTGVGSAEMTLTALGLSHPFYSMLKKDFSFSGNAKIYFSFSG